MTNTNTAIPIDEVVDFIHLEAELADSHRLQEWLELWNPERATYVIPYPDGDDGRLHVAIVRDDWVTLCQRVTRLESGSAHAQEPPSQLCRVIGRAKVVDGDDGSLEVSSNFTCVESRPHGDVLWAGTTIHTIGRRDDSALELWNKEVRLVNARSEIPALTFLI